MRAPKAQAAFRTNPDPNRPAPVISAAVLAASVGLFVLRMAKPGWGVDERLALHGPMVKREPWRLLSYALVHGPAYHLLANMLSLYAVGMPLEEELGTTKFGLLSLTSGVAAAAAVLAFDFHRHTVGASGIILGWFGAALSLAPPEKRAAMIQRLIPTAIVSFLPGVSWPAHLGGLLSGIPLGRAFRKDPSVRSA